MSEEGKSANCPFTRSAMSLNVDHVCDRMKLLPVEPETRMSGELEAPVWFLLRALINILADGSFFRPDQL